MAVSKKALSSKLKQMLLKTLVRITRLLIFLYIQAISMKTFWISLVLCLSLFFAAPVCAQEVGISQSPGVVELEARPGEVVTEKFVVGNVGDIRALVTSISNFKPADEVGHVSISSELTGPLRFALKNETVQFDQPYLLNEKSGQELVLEVRV